VADIKWKRKRSGFGRAHKRRWDMCGLVKHELWLNQVFWLRCPLSVLWLGVNANVPYGTYGNFSWVFIKEVRVCWFLPYPGLHLQNCIYIYIYILPQNNLVTHFPSFPDCRNGFQFLETPKTWNHLARPAQLQVSLTLRVQKSVQTRPARLWKLPALLDRHRHSLEFTDIIRTILTLNN
jgi:hypothetical protein